MKSIRTLIGAVAALAASSSSFAANCLANDPNCVNAVPEPGSLALVALAIAGVAVVARIKK